MFVLSVLEAPNTKTNSLCVQTHLAIKLFLILILILITVLNYSLNISLLARIVKNMRRNVFRVKQVVFENQCLK